MSLEIPLQESTMVRRVGQTFNLYFESGVHITAAQEKETRELIARNLSNTNRRNFVVLRQYSRNNQVTIPPGMFILGSPITASIPLRYGHIEGDVRNMTDFLSHNTLGSGFIDVRHGTLPPTEFQQALAPIDPPTPEVAKNFSREALVTCVIGNAASMMLLPESTGLHPEFMVGFLPIYNATRIEAAMSDRKIKYRAIGDVFLAHQRGSLDTLKIDGHFMGAFKTLYLACILTMQHVGQTKFKDLPLSAPQAFDPTVDLFGKSEVDPYVESHTTLPIITRTGIFLDMYLQTIEWHQEVMETGRETIAFHLLFRKFIEPTGYHLMKSSKKKEQFQLDYGTSLVENQRNEVAADIAWKATRIGYEMFRFGVTGGFSLPQLNMEAVASIPYGTNIKSLIGGFRYEKFFKSNLDDTIQITY